MSYNGSGTFLINSAGQPVVPGTTITTTAFNALTADLASGLTTAMTKDGQTVPTANIPMGGFKLTGLGAGTSATDAAQFGQLQNAPVATLITVSGADTITGTLVQTLTAYATGQQFSFVAAGTNTTAVTLNIDGLGAKAVTRTGAVALAAGALVSGQMAIVEYDGTRFQLINANAFTNLTVSGALTVGTTLAVTGVATLTAQPILSSLTASLPVFSDASKGLVSNTMTGTGSVMMSASPTTTGTLTAAAINASGLVAMAGAATVGTTLGVTGATTLSSTLKVGAVGLGGSTPQAGVGLYSAVAYLTGNNQYGILWDSTLSGTSSSQVFAGTVQAAAATTITNGYGLSIGSATLGAGAAITTNYGIKIENQTVGGTNYAIYTGTGAVRFGDITLINNTSGNTTLRAGIGTDAALAAGEGVEFVTTTGTSTRVLSYSRAASAFRALDLAGSTITLSPNNSTNATFSSTGLAITGTIAGTIFQTSTSDGLNNSNANPAIFTGINSAAGTAAIIDANGRLYKLASSRRYKENIIPMTVTSEQLAGFLSIAPCFWDYKQEEGSLAIGGTGLAGFIAEDLADLEILRNERSVLNNYDLEGRPDSNRDAAIIGLQHLVLQDHEARLAALQADFQAYKNSHP